MVDQIETQVGDSGFSNSNRRQGAAKGIESPPAFSMVEGESSRDAFQYGLQDTMQDPLQNTFRSESSSPSARYETDVANTQHDCRGVLSRPFFMGAADVDVPVECYEQYRNAQPKHVDQLAMPVFASLREQASDSLDMNTCMFASPSSDEVVRHEVTWKTDLLRKAYQCLGRLRAVFDDDGEPYHPHQILSEESPMILIEFAAFLHPGWTVDGPWNPSNLLPHDGLDGQGLFESPQTLFSPIAKVAPALLRRLCCRINTPFNVGAYIPPKHVERFIDAIQRLRDENAIANMPEFESQHDHALAMWHEAAAYAHRHGLGLIESADLYNRKEGILN